MRIRSAPPRSANLAEIPVPAPAPMTGLPSERVFLSLSHTWSRVNIQTSWSATGTNRRDYQSTIRIPPLTWMVWPVT